MGLLEKKNPKATPMSALRHGAICAVAGGLVFLFGFKPMYRDAWRIMLPIWCLLCGLVGALWEWQVAGKSTDDEDPKGD